MSERSRLFDHFPAVSTEEWMDKIRTDLKGADFSKTMVWKPVEGFEVMPFYRREDLDLLPHLDTMPGEFPFLRGTGKTDNSWFVRQDIEVNDIDSANDKALNILGRGVSSLGFNFSKEMKFSKEVIKSLLDSIYLEAIEINMAPSGDALELLNSLIDVLKENGARPEMIRGAIETDPLGRLMINGKLCLSIEEGMDYLAQLVKTGLELPGMKVIRANGSNFGNAGSTVIQELAMTLSMGNEYISQLTERGISPDDAAKSIGFTFGTGSGYFMEIAKLRAARMLWGTIVKKYNPVSEEAMKMNIHSVTSDWNKTIYDPYVNMLRTQTEAMSAILGGADSLTVKPFDSHFKKTGEFSERIARNQQLLLKEESHFDKIVDPAGGSYYIENLTSSVAFHAWELFVKIEEEGGFLEALKNGIIQSMVSETYNRRLSSVSKGRERFLGTNIFPDFRETLSDIKKPGAEEAPENTDMTVLPLKLHRATEDFEKLRMETDMSGKRPKVFMLTIGNFSMRKARSQFSSNFFAIAGYEVVDNIGFKSIKEGVDAALAANSDIIVLCSSDEEYDEFAPEALNLINGRAIFVIAGAPASIDQLMNKGVRYFINVRSDILETLQMFNGLTGIGSKA